MDEATSASVYTIAVFMLIFNAYLLVPKDKPDGVTLADSLASYRWTLALLHIVET
jgi:hypothetical protein